MNNVMNESIIEWYNNFDSIEIKKVENGYIVTNKIKNTIRIFENGYYTTNQLISWCDTLVAKWSKN